MTRKVAVILSVIFSIVGCSDDGGSRGSGISTEVAGNIVTVGAASTSRSPFAGITVAVEGTSSTTSTDLSGRFSLRGDFYGAVRIVFQRSSDALLAHVDVRIPAGGTLTLVDVSIDPVPQVAAAASEQIQCEGLITGTNCDATFLTMVSAVQSSSADTEGYTVRLDTSTLRDSTGQALACADLRSGERVMVQATVNSDGSFGDATVEVQS